MNPADHIRLLDEAAQLHAMLVRDAELVASDPVLFAYYRKMCDSAQANVEKTVTCVELGV
jgi:hypothetical protein